MKIATYNILKGGSKRVHWAKMIEEHHVDLLLVQESYHPDEHLPPMLYPEFVGKSTWEMAEKNGWGSAIFSRMGSLGAISVPGYTGWVVGASLQDAACPGGYQKVLVFSLHAPSHNEPYHKQVNKILDEIAKIRTGRSVVIAGDFNLSVSHHADSTRPTRKQDLAIQERLKIEFGLINCWECANPNQPLAQTLRWTGDRTIPYHCDGIFVPHAWKERLVACEVLSGDGWNSLSDHNPVVATFDFANDSELGQ